MIIQLIKDTKAFDSFVESNASVHYMKTSAWGEFKKFTEKYQYEMLGFYQDDLLVGTALLLKKSMFGHMFGYIPLGPAIDYSNKSLRQSVIQCLKEYAKKSKFEFLRIDPNVIRVSRDILGNQIEGINNEDFTEELIRSGFKHKGYGYAYNGSWTNRYTLRIDIRKEYEEIHKNFTKPRKTSLNRHLVNGVTTRLGDFSDISDLMQFEKQLSEQDGFKPHSEQFFKKLLTLFGNHARMYVTEINLSQMIDGIQKELSGKKYAKDPEARTAKEKELLKANELMNKFGSIVKIACGLFISYGNYSWDLYTYNHKEFNFIKPVDNLHAFAIKDMKQRGVEFYDMCGFSGVTTKDDPEYGLYNYKRSFGPEFIEQIGEFDYPIKENRYNRFLRQKRLEVRIRRRIWRARYKKKNL